MNREARKKEQLFQTSKYIEMILGKQPKSEVFHIQNQQNSNSINEFDNSRSLNTTNKYSSTRLVQHNTRNISLYIAIWNGNIDCSTTLSRQSLAISMSAHDRKKKYFFRQLSFIRFLTNLLRATIVQKSVIFQISLRFKYLRLAFKLLHFIL